jgi:hypothetical protein
MILSALLLAGTFVVPLPPKQYDHTYKGNLKVSRMELDRVHSACGGVLGDPKIYACAKTTDGGNSCVVILPKMGGEITKYVMGRLWRHEIGHCNGWAGDHPNPNWK